MSMPPKGATLSPGRGASRAGDERSASDAKSSAPRIATRMVRGEAFARGVLAVGFDEQQICQKTVFAMPFLPD
jgi:hypothetical protein